MKYSLRIKKLSLLTMLAVSVMLACNIPRPLVRWGSPSTDFEEQISFEHTLVADTQATLVSAEGDVVGLKPPHGTEWTCLDVNGEVSEIENTVAYYSETMKLINADYEIELFYDAEDNWITLGYLTEFEREVAVIGEDDLIEAWDHETWSDSGHSGYMSLWSDGTFQGLLHIKTTSSQTWPKSSTSTSEVDYHIIGLVDPMDYRRSFLCNMGRNTPPEDLGFLTVDNFLANCPFYYYECTAK